MRLFSMLGVAALAALVLLPLAGCVDAGSPAFTDVIVYMSYDPEAPTVNSVWMMLPDGSRKTRLVDPDEAAGTLQGVLNFAGDTLLYTDGALQQIRARDLATGNGTVLHAGQNVQTLAYSPDGGTVLFSALNGANPGDLWSMGADGANPHVLLAAPSTNIQYVNPGYNRDGSRIVFVQKGPGISRHIYSMDAAGGDIVQLTTTGLNLHPSFLPDGRILYSCSPDPMAADMDFWIMDADGGNKYNLTNTPTVEKSFATCNATGTAITYHVGSGWQSGDIYVAPFDGVTLGPATNLTADTALACWRPAFGRVATSLLNSALPVP